MGKFAAHRGKTPFSFTIYNITTEGFAQAKPSHRYKVLARSAMFF